MENKNICQQENRLNKKMFSKLVNVQKWSLCIYKKSQDIQVIDVSLVTKHPVSSMNPRI